MKFNTLGRLRDELLKIETDDVLRVLDDLDAQKWAAKRNTTVHEAAKIDVDNQRT